MTEQNGIRRPKPGGTCAAIWNLLDNLSAEIERPPTPAEAKVALKNYNPATASKQFGQWRKFYGVSALRPNGGPVKTRKPEPETRDGFTMSQERLNELTAEDNAKIEAAASKPNFEEV